MTTGDQVPTAEQDGYVGRTRWTGALRTPVRAFIDAETRASVILLTAVLSALIWANVAPGSYEGAWGSNLSIRLESWSLSMSVRDWINTGLMSLFFFSVGLEARREADIGELREVRRITLPFLAGLGGMAVPIGIFLAFNQGDAAARGWGAVMSTDTAFALGVISVVGAPFLDRLRVFLISVLVVDDIAALLVIAFVYTEHLELMPLIVAVALFAVLLVVRARRVRAGVLYTILAVAMWVAVLRSGVDPLVVGLALGLLVYAYPAPREDLELATERFREFREQPTPELARQARASVEAAVSPNERLALLWRPWTGYVVVPVFALANAGVSLGWSTLEQAFSSRITLGIIVAYVVGKPLGIVLTSAAVTAASGGRLRPPIGWGGVVGVAASAGVGFTVTLLVASLAFDQVQLQAAKIGVLFAAVAATVVSWSVFRVIDALATGTRLRALLGRAPAIIDLAEPVDADIDHIRGPKDSPVTLLEYGDLECPYCGKAEPVIRELLRDFADLTYVWRHLPLDDVHAHARLAAEAAEAAGAQGAFWEMHDLLLAHQDALRLTDLIRYGEELGLDSIRFQTDLRHRTYAARVHRDVESADLSGVTGTPTFFVNGRRHRGAFDLKTLTKAVTDAGARAVASP
jgi:Na+/H+ antiporter NhaA